MFELVVLQTDRTLYSSVICFTERSAELCCRTLEQFGRSIVVINFFTLLNSNEYMIRPLVCIATRNLIWRSTRIADLINVESMPENQLLGPELTILAISH